MEMAKITETAFFSGDETYMNDRQLVYFKNKLICLKMEFIEKVQRNKKKIKSMGGAIHADILDRSNSLADIEREARAQERNSQILRQIDAALQRIEDGSFGYCKLTGGEIGLKRLEALPFTALSIEAIQRFDN